MKVGKNNEILEATIAELKAEWKNNGWDKEYTFDKYFDIQTRHNKIKIKQSTPKQPTAEKAKRFSKKEQSDLKKLREILPD